MSFAVQPRGSCPSTSDQHVLALLLQERLRGQHVLDFRRADAVRQRAERAVRGRVRVAADDRHARQRSALLRPDDVHDALTQIVHLELRDAVGVAVRIERVDLQLGDRIGDAVAAVRGRDVVVRHRQVRADAPHRTLSQLQTFERLRAGDFVQQVTVDVENRRAVFFRVDHVRVPQFVVESLCHGMRGSIDCGLTVSVDYATQRPAWAAQPGRKPIKNRELGGSVDTCIGVTRQERTRPPACCTAAQMHAQCAGQEAENKTPRRKTRRGVFISRLRPDSQRNAATTKLSGLKPDQRCAIGLASRCVSPMNS